MVGGGWDANGGNGDGSGHGRHGQHRRARRLRWPLAALGVTGGAVLAVVLTVAVSLGQTGGVQACAAVLSASQALTAGQPAGGGSQIATHYVLQGLPNCSYASPPADGLFVALSPAEYNSAAGCGGYLEVTGPDGSVRVKVIDQCPECATGHIDLSEAAFAKLAPLSAGLINVSYTYLTDPALPGPISMEVKSGSSQYWLALLADNTGNPLTSVQVETSSGWTSLARANYNYWIAQSGAGSGPFTVRLTDTQGHTTTVSGITLSPGTVQSTSTYMYGAGSAPAPAPATQPPTPAAPTTQAPAPPAASAPAPTPPMTSAAAPSPSTLLTSAPPSPTRKPAARAKKTTAKAAHKQPRIAATTLPTVTATPVARASC